MNYGLSSSRSATNREITGTLAEAQGTKEARSFDGKKEVELRGQGNMERFGMKTYELTPGGSSIAGTSVPIRTGQELFDWSRDKHPIQEVNKQMDSSTRSAVALQNNNTDIVADIKVEASNTYQGELNQALETQASQSKQAFNTGSSIASSSSRQGAGIQLSGIRRSAEIERGANQLNFEGRSEAANINQTEAMEAARLRMASTVVTGFFRDMDRRLEEMKPKY